jgi:SAM-dependent methyltransferase
MFAENAFKTLLASYPFTTVLDVGAGELVHTREFSRYGKQVTAVDHQRPPAVPDAVEFVQADLSDPQCPVWARKFDCVWCSHVLEHQRNAGWLLDRMLGCLEEGGILAITVPPLKHQVVGGHLSVWNLGLLCYNLIMAGLDLRGAMTFSHGYNLSIITRKKLVDLSGRGLRYDRGDIEKLAEFFPVPGLKQDFDGRTMSN